MPKCEGCKYNNGISCTIMAMGNYGNTDCCEICVYKDDCLIRGDLVHWCKAYAEIDSHERLAKLNKGNL